MSHIVIVGAGLSGLTAAHSLQKADHDITVLDKGRGVGGRMATRRLISPTGEVAVFDHGAQFFTVRDEQFRVLVDEWMSRGVVRQWCRGFVGEDGFARYLVNGGMATLAKHLARGIDVRTSTMVFAVQPCQSSPGPSSPGQSSPDKSSPYKWTVVIDDGTTLDCDAVIMTCPLPQSYSLTVTAQVELPEELLMTDYARTIALLAVLDSPSAVPAPGGIQNPDDVFSFIGDNVAKGISSVPALTFHANELWSTQHWDDTSDQGLQLLTTAAQRYLGSARIVASEYKKWRFATPKKFWPERFYATGPHGDSSLVFAGDAFSGPKVEGAVLSGLAAADHLKQYLNH